MKYVFMFVEFGVEIGMVNVFFVWNVYCSNDFVLFISLMNNGFKWFSVGCVIVLRMCGEIFDGFGFINVCLGGRKVDSCFM